MLRPQTAWQRLTAGESLFEIGYALILGATAIANGLRSYHSQPPDMALASTFFGLGGATTVLFVVRALLRNRAAQNTDELHALDGVLHALHGILTAGKNGHGLRICVFVPRDDPEIAHQITNYVGTPEPYGRGRDMSCKCGVVGRAFRSGDAQYDKLPNNAHVIDYLVQNHGFARQEAATMRQDRSAWAAIPVGTRGKVVAVIFLDSLKRDFFGGANAQCRKTLEGATLGVAEFIAQTYN